MSEFEDTYKTIEKASTGEYREKGSKFISYAYNFNSEEELNNIISYIKSVHPKARHYCFAYKIGLDGNKFRSYDDGEPSGTAGKPILGQIQSHGLTNICVLVVRYFGGTKLGASGLIHAYRQAADQALTAAIKIDKIISDQYELSFKYEDMGHVMNVIKDLDIDIVEKKFETIPTIVINLRQNTSRQLLLQLKANIMHLNPEELSDSSLIEKCTFKKL